jgi:predicted DNA-binding protein (UPF0278 family)
MISDLDAWMVVRYPEHYQKIKGSSGVGDIYIEHCIEGYDKHFWVTEEAVERVKAEVRNLEKGGNHE